MGITTKLLLRARLEVSSTVIRQSSGVFFDPLAACLHPETHAPLRDFRSLLDLSCFGGIRASAVGRRRSSLDDCVSVRLSENSICIRCLSDLHVLLRSL